MAAPDVTADMEKTRARIRDFCGMRNRKRSASLGCLAAALTNRAEASSSSKRLAGRRRMVRPGGLEPPTFSSGG
jgi:hypothetical protein